MKIYLVGGAVRDMLLGKTPHDKDYVVFGATAEQMLGMGFQQVGRGFPVFLHPDTKEEYALARKEIKTGNKHNSFKFIFTPDITEQEDVQRRDFTCNALLYDEEKQQLFEDTVGGIEDIKNHILRHVNTEHFAEDPLRVLRMCRFAAKLDFIIAPETMNLAKKMVQEKMLSHLTPERVWKEFEFALEAKNFDKFILLMKKCGALQEIMPEVADLWNVPENTEHHPEANSGSHTILVLQQSQNLSAKVKFALLLHDVGKTKTPPEILPKHISHEVACLPIITEICQRLKIPYHYRDYALMVAKNHMKLIRAGEMSKATLLDFVENISNFKNKRRMIDFIMACRADMRGRQKIIANTEITTFKNAVKRVLLNFAIQQKISASDIPNFAELKQKKDGTVFAENYRQNRLSKVI